MSEQDWIVKFILPGVDLAQKEAREGETLKHLQGKHNQKRHGWRYSGNQVANARSAMRGQTAEERAEYRKRAGMPTPKKIEKPKVEKKPKTKEEIVNILKKEGGKYWEKGEHQRVYFDPSLLTKHGGLDVSFYKTGNVSGATLRGRDISNAEAKRILGAVSGSFFLQCKRRSVLR